MMMMSDIHTERVENIFMNPEESGRVEDLEKN